MINYKGQLYEHWSNLPLQSLSFSQLADQFSIPIYWKENNANLLEATYFHIMSAARRWRLEIPMSFTPELLTQQIDVLNKALDHNKSRVYQLNVFRETGISIEQPNSKMGWVISDYGDFEVVLNHEDYQISLYREHLIATDGLSDLPTTHQQLRDLALVFAHENDYADCLLLNTDKKLVDSVFGSIFLLLNGEIHTPDLASGVRHAVLRTAFLDWLQKETKLSVFEKPIVPFELQKATAIAIIDPYKGMTMVSQYRKKSYEDDLLANLFSDFWSQY